MAAVHSQELWLVTSVAVLFGSIFEDDVETVVYP